MIYLLDIEGEITFPYTDRQLRKDNKHVSFQRVMTDETRATYGMYPVEELDDPALDESIEMLETGVPVYTDAWRVQRVAVAMSQKEIDQKAILTTLFTKNQAQNLLRESDFTALLDTAVNLDNRSEWVQYRKDIRRIRKSPETFDGNWPQIPKISWK